MPPNNPENVSVRYDPRKDQMHVLLTDPNARVQPKVAMRGRHIAVLAESPTGRLTAVRISNVKRLRRTLGWSPEERRENRNRRRRLERRLRHRGNHSLDAYIRAMAADEAKHGPTKQSRPPTAFYNRDGDTIVAILRPEACFTRLAGPAVTLHLSRVGEQLVGFSVNNVTGIIATARKSAGRPAS